MPPNTAWEWVETYGPVELDPEIAHGPYEKAWQSLAEIVAEEDLDKVLKGATHMRRKADKLILEGSPWGAVEEKKREALQQKPLSHNLTFTCAEDNEWLSLLNFGTLGIHSVSEAPKSWMLDREYTEMLAKALTEQDKNNWYSWMQYGMIKLAAGEFDEAYRCFEASNTIEENLWAHYGMMCLYWNKDEKEAAAKAAKTVLSMVDGNVSVIRVALDILVKVGEFDFVLAYTENCCQDGNILLYRLTALVRLEKLEEAEYLMNHYRDEICTNVREGELSVTDLRRDFLRMKAEQEGRPIENIEPEQEWNFVMYARQLSR